MRPKRQPPVWYCQNPDCLESGPRHPIPLIAHNRNGRATKIIVCPVCGKNRKATESERALVEDAESKKVIEAVSVAALKKFPHLHLGREQVIQDMTSIAIKAAMKFPQQSGRVPFRSYLYGYLIKELNSKRFDQVLANRDLRAKCVSLTNAESIPSDDTSREIEQKEQAELVHSMIVEARLTENEHHWVVHRFGLFDHPQLSDPYIFPNLSPDRRSQIAESAIEKLRTAGLPSLN